METVLILGGSGMLGHKLAQVFQRHFRTIATVRQGGDLATRPGFERVRVIPGVEAGHFEAFEAVLGEFRPSVVVNCIGLVKQTAAAKDPIACILVNSLLPHRLAELCTTRGSRLIHISTDCVFSGKKGHYTELDPPDAEDLYGRSKLLGEIAQDRCLTLRTSIIGRELGSANGLVEWFLAQEGRSVRGYSQAIFSGLPTITLARVLVDIIKGAPALAGLYHLSAEPIDKCRLLHLLRERFRSNIKIVPDDHVRIDRSLDSALLRSKFAFDFPAWKNLIAEMVNDAY